MTPTSQPLVIGIVGCGQISDSYFRTLAMSPFVRIAACADARPGFADAKAALHGVPAFGIDRLLDDESIELVLNLTVPTQHAPIGHRVLAAGKHLYQEKPIATNMAEARALLADADTRGLRVGCAPDTVLGASHQVARSLIDSGAIGQPLSGTARMLSHGMEAWHPSPGFYYRKGGGPLLDIGPYFVAQLVNLLGPVSAVTAMTRLGLPQRVIGRGSRAAEVIDVEVATTAHGILQFQSGAQVALSLSWDVWQHGQVHPLEIYGTEGSLLGADPSQFGGSTQLSRNGGDWSMWAPQGRPYGADNMTTPSGRQVANHRGAGVVDMALAIRNQRPHRMSGAFALHVLEVLEGLEASARDGCHIPIIGAAERPEAMPDEYDEPLSIGRYS